MFTLTRWSIVLAAMVVLSGCGSLGSPKAVGPAFTGDEIKKVIVGNTIQGPAGTVLYDWYYAADGKVTGVVGESDDDSGTWLIKNDKIYCHTWDEYFDGVQHCYEWYKANTSGHYIMKNVDTDRGADIEVWEVIQGNPYNM